MQYERKVFRKNKVEATFLLRAGTSDEKSAAETWVKNAYEKRGAGFIIEPGERWADLGANIGAFSLYALRKGAEVLAVEAETDNYQTMLRNFGANGFNPKTLLNAVVPDDDDGKELSFWVNRNPMAFRRHTLYADYMGGRADKAEETKVRGIGFTRIVEMGYPNLKVNIEGAEIEIFLTMPTSTSAQIRKLVFEYSFDKDKRISTYRRVLNLLNEHFQFVTASRQIDLNMDVFPYYPPNVYLFCQNQR